MKEIKNYNGIIISPDTYRDTVNSLKQSGLDIIYSVENKSVMNTLKYHADMQIVNIDASIYICAPECYGYYSNILRDYNKNIICGNTFLSCNYPHDIAYNIIITNMYAIHNFKYTDKKILEILEKSLRKIGGYWLN